MLHFKSTLIFSAISQTAHTLNRRVRLYICVALMFDALHHHYDFRLSISWKRLASTKIFGSRAMEKRTTLLKHRSVTIATREMLFMSRSS